MATNPSAIERPQVLIQRTRTAARGWLAPGSVFYASTMAANALGFVYLIVLARVLPVAAYGEVVSLTALVYVFAVITRSLQARAAQIVTNEPQQGADQHAVIARALRRMALPLLAGAVLLFAAGAAISPAAADFLRLPSTSPVVLLAAYVATHLLLSGPRGLLLGSGRLYHLSWVTLLDPVVRLAAGWALANTLGTSGAMLGYVAGNAAATIAAAAPFLAAGRAPGHGAPLTLDRHFLTALALNGALMALASVDPVAIRRYFSDTVAGHYAVAFLLGRIILLSTNAVSWVVFSRTVTMQANDARVKPILLRGLSLGGAIAGALTALYLIAPGAVTRAIGGGEYAAAGNFVGLVGLEMLLFTLVSVLTYYHLATRNQRLWLPFAAALGAEALLISLFHGEPTHILLATTAVMAGLLVWVGAETLLQLRVGGRPKRSNDRRPRMGMIVHSHYPSDPRVRREAEALIEAGWAVDLICLPDGGQAAYDEIGGVRVFRVPVQRQRSGGPLSYLREYGAFFAAASWKLARLHASQRYDLVQAHNMPDFLVFAGLFPRLTGARVILDIHDLVPEFYSVRFGLPPSHPVVRLTRWVQRLSAHFADHVLTAGEPFRRQIVAGGVPPEKVTSIMNSPDPRLFAWRTATARNRRRDQFVLSYHGTLSEYNDLGVVLRALALLRDELPGLRLRVFGRGRALPDLERQARELGLEGQVEFLGFRPLDQIPALIVEADAGIVPQRRSAFTALNYPTKAFEYIALGVPVLMGHTPALDELFGHIPGSFFQPESPEEIAEGLRRLARDARQAERIAAAQQSVCARFAWADEKRRYLSVVSQLANGRLAASEAAVYPATEPIGD